MSIDMVDGRDLDEARRIRRALLRLVRQYLAAEAELTADNLCLDLIAEIKERQEAKHG